MYIQLFVTVTVLMKYRLINFVQKTVGFFGFFGFFVFSIFFGLFRNSLFQLFRFYTETETFDVSIEQKLTEDPPKQFIREYS